MASTPGPTTRARSRQTTPTRGALPALDSRASYGYGARGKATLRTQVVQQDTEFDTAFRGAVAQDNDDDDDERRADRATTPLRRRTAASSRRGPQPAMGTLAEGEEVVTAAQPMDRTETIIEHRAAYDARVAPSAAAVTAHTIPRYIPQVVRDSIKVAMLVLGCLVAFIAFLRAMMFLVPSTASALTPLGSSIAVGWSMFWQLPPFNTTAGDLRSEWLAFKYEKLTEPITSPANITQRQWNALTIGRLTDLEKRVRVVEQRLHMHDDAIKAFRGILPQAVLISTKDGKWILPDEFWPALQDGFATDEHIRRPLWEKFLEDNDQRLKSYYCDAAHPDTRRLIENKTVVTSEMLQVELANRYSEIARDHGEELRKVEARLLDDLLAKTRSEASDQVEHMRNELSTDINRFQTEADRKLKLAVDHQVEQFPSRLFGKLQAASLAFTSQVVNTHNALTSVNFFSTGHGARIDPYFTSPTYVSPRSMWSSLWSSSLALEVPNPPITALVRWDEATECWCAATTLTPEGKHQSQIAITMAHKIYPETLVIEHINRRATLDIASAPKDFEVWVEVPDIQQAKELSVEMRKNNWRPEWCQTDTPSPRHICLMAASYDLHGNNWVQSFDAPHESKAYGLMVNKVIIRATSNWGRDPYTCFYRLRMLGEKVPTT